MKAIIIEDELLAQEKLEHLLRKINPSLMILARLSSVKETLVWLAKHDPPDLAFVDIQLSDDHSFEIFRRFDPSFPLIFTTAYDKYLLESFEFNSIDYLLKPISEEKLRRTLEKVERLRSHFSKSPLHDLLNTQGPPSHRSPGFPDRIVARKGNQFVVVPMEDVAYFFTVHKIAFLKDFGGKHMIVDKNLGALESLLDPSHFIRLNRKYIASAKAIAQFTPSKGKIQVTLKPDAGEAVFVSKESAPAFRHWIREK